MDSLPCQAIRHAYRLSLHTVHPCRCHASLPLPHGHPEPCFGVDQVSARGMGGFSRGDPTLPGGCLPVPPTRGIIHPAQLGAGVLKQN